MSDAIKLYLDIRLPNHPYRRMNFNLTNPERRLGDWKYDVQKDLNHSNALEFIYLGNVLSDDLSLTENNIRSGGTIHVLQKKCELITAHPVLTNEEIQGACTSYNRLRDFSRANTDAMYPEALKIILAQYPDFHNELGALAILKNKVLLTKLRKRDFADKVAETYPMLISASAFIVKTFNETMMKWIKNGQIVPFQAVEESEMSDLDVSMESDDDSPQNEIAPTGAGQPSVAGRISPNRLANALLMVGSSAARTTEAPTSSAADNRPSTSNINRITSAAFQSALLSAYREAAQATPAAQSDAPSPTEPVVDDNRAYIEQSRSQYESELHTMHEMGLLDDVQNVQALIVCSGDVERAINLVLASVGGL